MQYFCCDERRRNAVAAHATLNGIEFLEVLDDPSQAVEERQRTLFVHFLKPLAATALAAANVRIDGGERIRNVLVSGATVGTGSQDHVLTVTVDRVGDFSPYTLRLVESDEDPPEGFDPQLAAIDFTFKAACPSPFDCRIDRVCPPEQRVEPEIDYLAKDYASFRRLLLDRLARSAPAWRERNAADLGVALVELLAYVGDHLSYAQDAVATEAYLATARRRVSLRRHARLVDYFMHDGCNARAWVHVQVESDNVPLAKGTRLLTQVAEHSRRIVPDSAAYDMALTQHPAIFETMHAAALFEAHNELPLYTWGDRECCLPKGATRATLKGHFSHLNAGDVVLFEEVASPRTGRPEDADPSRRHAVRIVEVRRTDGQSDPLTDPLQDEAITEIAWHAEDALPFPLCISAITDQAHDAQFHDGITVARGNIVLADHGLSIEQEPLGEVPEPSRWKAAAGAHACGPRPLVPLAPRFRPRLTQIPLTQAGPFDPAASARNAMQWSLREVRPSIVLEGEIEGKMAPWLPARDLLGSDSLGRFFVVEVEEDGAAFLRFGDDRHGQRPASGTVFSAAYRQGNGAAGNVGADTIAHVVSGDSAIVAVRNPLPAAGGLEPETPDDVRHRAPSAFQTVERAVTEEDYAEVMSRHPDVQRAAATFRWTGSWHTVFVTVDRTGGVEVDAAFDEASRRHLERYRMAGYDVEIDGPRMVPLEIELHVCVQPDYFRSDVKAALLEALGSRVRANGELGLFHPDTFTFGQPVYLSLLYAAAQSVPGVASVTVKTFQRQGTPDQEAIDKGWLTLGRLEIARLDNDRNFPERGVLEIALDGGK